MARKRISKIKKSILERPFLFSFIFILYILFNVILNKVYITYRTISGNLYYGIPFVLFNLLVAFLIAICVVLIFAKIKELRMMNPSASGLTSIGIFFGILGGACPGCFAGVFPAVLGIFGSTLSLGDLPLLGIELQIISSALLIISIFLLTKDNVCRVEFNTKSF